MRDWTISAKTTVCGLIGDPVEHSMSPAMHNAAFRELGLDYVYLPFRVTREKLGQAIAGMRGLNFRGLNVTIPHKIEVRQFLDGMDPLAEKIGAVNTIVNSAGVLRGYNTDAGGFLQAMLAKGVEPKGEHIAVIGAGGAAKAVTFILADRGAHLSILNRSQELNWAMDLASHISQVFGRKVDALELNKGNLARVLDKAKILVNATSVGMSPKVDDTPVDSDLLRPELVVYDIVYNPIKTRLMQEAEAVNAMTIGGLDMLVWQGALAFEMWTGQKAPVGLMKEEARKLLG